MTTLITQIASDPRDGQPIPVEWVNVSENWMEYNLVLAPPSIPGQRPEFILTLCLN